MDRLLAGLSLPAFVGMSLLLSEIRWFRRPPLFDRLTPYTPGGHRRTHRDLSFSVSSFRDLVGPLSLSSGEALGRLFGVEEDIGVRLQRIHSPIDAGAFRTRQLSLTVAAVIVGAMGATALGRGPLLSMFIVIGAPLLVFLLVEQKVTALAERWQRQVFLELPVVAEQLGMLTAAGWSLGAALGRIAERGAGCCARDLDRVTRRVQQGLSERDALREWADIASVESLDRLVSILAMNGETADLGWLVGDEVRAIRREAQRELIEVIERRNQQVWIPVTVAALIPGVLLMGVPFVDALTLFSTA